MQSPIVPSRASLRRFELLMLLWVPVMALVASAAGIAHARELRQVLAQNPDREQSAWLAILTVGGALALAIVIGAVPGRWRRVAFGACICVSVLIPVLMSGNGLALAAAGALGALSCWPGCVVATLLLRTRDRLVAWVVGSAYGVALLALIAAGLGRVGILRAWAVWTVLVALVALTLAFPAGRRLLRSDLAGVAAWMRQPDGAWGWRWLAIGLLLGACWIGLIGALAPEIGSDAIRQRLAAAALFAREGRLVALEPLTFSAQPGLGELAYAAVLACGPLAAAKLFNFAAGLWCGAGVWALGRRIGGRRGALVGLLLFGTTPFVVALSQTAYADLFATLLAIAVALALVARPQLTPGMLGAAALALVGGLTVKSSFRVVAVGLLAAILAVAWRDWGRRLNLSWRRILTLLVPLVVVLVAAALLIWRFGRELPGAALVAPRLEAYGRAFQSQLDIAEFFGVGRSPGELASLPYALLWQTGRFGEMRAGFTGYAWLLFVPLLLFARPGRRRWPLLAGVVVAAATWVLITQYLRYAAPIVALLAALSGAAYALASRRCRRPLALGMRAVLVALAALWLLGFLNTTLFYPGDLPYRVVFGRQSRDAYLSEHVVAYLPLQLLDRESGAGRAITAYEYPQLYSRVPLFGANTIPGATDEAALLRLLDARDYTHVVIDRGFLPANWDRLQAIDEEFLRRNAVLVGGERNAYLYRLVPPAERGHDQGWARGPELLPNGGFEQASGERPMGWSASGHPIYDRAGASAKSGRAAFRSTPQDWYTATVPVKPQAQYLLSHATRAEGGNGLARLQVNWLDGADQIVGVSIEVVPTSTRRYAQFSMLATAPPGASRARLYLVAQQGTTWFDDASFRAVSPEAGAMPGVGDSPRGVAVPVRVGHDAWRRETWGWSVAARVG